MILQSSYGCYLTQSADTPIGERLFITNTFIPNAESAQNWMEITEAEKDEMVARKTFFGEGINYQSISMIDKLQKDVIANINNIEMTPDQAIQMATYFPEFSDVIGEDVKTGFRFRYDNVLYEVLFDHTVLAEYMPARQRIARYKMVVPEPEVIPEPEIIPDTEVIPDVVPEPEVIPDTEVDPEIVPEPEVIPEETTDVVEINPSVLEPNLNA